MHAVRHIPRSELANQFVHHGFYNTGSVSTGNVTVQPTLGVGQGSDRVLGTADDKTGFGYRIDQRLDLGFVGHNVFNIGADGETDITVSKLVSDIAQGAQGENVKNTLGTGLDGKNLVTAVGNVAQNAGLGSSWYFHWPKFLRIAGCMYWKPSGQPDSIGSLMSAIDIILS